MHRIPAIAPGSGNPRARISWVRSGRMSSLRLIREPDVLANFQPRRHGTGSRPRSSRPRTTSCDAEGEQGQGSAKRRSGAPPDVSRTAGSRRGSRRSARANDERDDARRAIVPHQVSRPNRGPRGPAGETSSIRSGRPRALRRRAPCLPAIEALEQGGAFVIDVGRRTGIDRARFLPCVALARDQRAADEAIELDEQRPRPAAGA